MLCPLIKLTILGSEPVIHPILQQKNDFVNKKRAKVSAAPAAMPADCRCEWLAIQSFNPFHQLVK